RRRAARAAGGYSEGGLSEQKSVRHVFANHARIAWVVAGNDPGLAPSLTAEGFEAAQLAKATGTAAAMAGMGARFAAGDDALARLVRDRQDATERWRRANKKLVGAVGQPPDQRDRNSEQQLRAQLADLENTLEDLDRRLSREFPEYAELASPQPLSLAETRKLLGPGEAMLTYLVGDEDTFVWVVLPSDARMFRLGIGGKELAESVTGLRKGLDATGITGLADVPAFDTTKSFQLYGRIFAAAEGMIAGLRHLFVVPDGALQSLPLGVLVTEKPSGEPTDFSGYREVPWLARKYAMTTLPSVSSLRALRRFARATRASKPFVGFGDPLLKGHPGERRGVKLASLFTSRGVADVNAVRNQLAPLPDTADELEAMAEILGAGKADLFLRARATETRVKNDDLTDYKVLAFATHGLVAGDLKGLAEPALVLTPPKIGTAEDDGLLTAGEVATLKLNADLVVLSACNTASADGSPNAEALSGLTKAFFYAGSRSLLVSHWPVGSDAAVKLTTRMLKEVANDNSVGRAEGLRRSMLALMDTPGKPYYAHPMFWAPFVIVGEGGVYAPSW
ncbi:MAG: CHAT domain-containing protein, partial [Rhodospirillales bacterium]